MLLLGDVLSKAVGTIDNELGSETMNKLNHLLIQNVCARRFHHSDATLANARTKQTSTGILSLCPL